MLSTEGTQYNFKNIFEEFVYKETNEQTNNL